MRRRDVSPSTAAQIPVLVLSPVLGLGRQPTMTCCRNERVGVNRVPFSELTLLGQVLCEHKVSNRAPLRSGLIDWSAGRPGLAGLQRFPRWRKVVNQPLP